MENQQIKIATKIGAYTALIGALCMLIGAALWGISGADLDGALDNGELSNYLITANENSMFLMANLTIWIIGVILIGAAGTMMASLCVQRKAIAKIATYIYWIAVPLGVASFVAWLAIVVRLSPDSSATSALIAEAMGWFASRADWIATILIVGLGPALISVAGRGEWVPKWLFNWGVVALFAGVLSLIGMYAGGLTTYGFLVVPVGVGWTIASSMVLFKRSRAA